MSKIPVRNPRRRGTNQERKGATDFTKAGILAYHERLAESRNNAISASQRAARRVHGVRGETKSAPPVSQEIKLPLTPLQNAALDLHNHKKTRPEKPTTATDSSDHGIYGAVGGEEHADYDNNIADWRRKRNRLLGKAELLHARAKRADDPNATTSGGLFGIGASPSVVMPNGEKIKLTKGGKKHKRKTKKRRRKHKKRARTHKKKHSRKTRSKKHHKKRRRSTKKRRRR